MVTHPLPADATITDVLRDRAHRTPRARLIIDIAGGTLVAAAAIWARPPGWVMLAAAGGCFASYGAWAIAELRLAAREWPEPLAHERLWRSLRTLTSVVGMLAFVLLLLSFLGLALGPLIS